ncbi:MAG: protein-export chaperone SecB [Pseudomonadota bacterium]|nr:protein-export chaperone SecB [Pseudomonadota bacterium]
MAKAPPAKEDNGQGVTQQAGPALSVLAQYIKDFSFENPNSPNSLRPRENSPNINIGINVTANGLSKTDYEVLLKLEAKAVSGEETIFNAELLYAGIFRVQGIPQEALKPSLMIECPRLLFPFARQIIADATRNGGFPPLMIDPVDFTRLYQSNQGEGVAKAN